MRAQFGRDPTAVSKKVYFKYNSTYLVFYFKFDFEHRIVCVVFLYVKNKFV